MAMAACLDVAVSTPRSGAVSTKFELMASFCRAGPIVSVSPLLYSDTHLVNGGFGVQEFGVETGRVSVMDEQPDERYRQSNRPVPDEILLEGTELSSSNDEPLTRVQQLELELERYRLHAERTSKLFLAATKYAEWVRENARRDAELALRKASARVERLEATAHKLEWAETELARKQDELRRLDALTEETRTRLSAFLTAGLEVLSTTVEPGEENGPPSLDELQHTLHRQLASTSPPPSGSIAERETRDR